jgi:carboxyl-terminal processing protease
MGEADLDYAIEFDRVRTARFEPFNMVRNEIVNSLRGQSAQRVSNSAEFAKLSRDVVRYKEIKDAKTVPLNEEKYMSRRESERDAEKEEEKHLDEPATAKDVIFRDDFYDKELLNVTLDYFTELQKGNLARAN